LALKLDGKHLVTCIQLKIIYKYVLTENYQKIREMYPIFTKACEEHSNVRPVLGHNFYKKLRQLCEEGYAESREVMEYTRDGRESVKPTKLWRRKYHRKLGVKHE
jgi:hypothetical protein